MKKRRLDVFSKAFYKTKRVLKKAYNKSFPRRLPFLVNG